MDRKIVATTTTFGAALAALGVAPELQAEIVSLSFSPGSVSWQGTASAPSVPVIINGIGATFSQWNDGVGKTVRDTLDIGGLAEVFASSTISPATFPTAGGAAFTASASGTRYVGFSHAGNVGWFRIDLGGFGGAVTYLEGAYGNDGESLHVGTIPAPGALALLALGAVGVRRSRKRVA